MKKWIYRILLVVCLCVFGYSAYNLWDIYSQKQQVENETKQIEDFSESKTEENQDEIQAEISKQESNDELKNEDKENSN